MNCCVPIGYTTEGVPFYATASFPTCICPIDLTLPTSATVPAASPQLVPPTIQGTSGWLNWFSSISPNLQQTIKNWIQSLINRVLSAAEWAAIWLLIVVGVVGIAAVALIAVVRA